MKYKLTIETDELEEIQHAAQFEDWQLVVDALMRDLRSGYKYEGFEWLPRFKDVDITAEQGSDMCDLIADHIREIMDDYGVQL